MPLEAATISAIFESILKKLAANAIIKFGKGALASLQDIGSDYGEHLRQSYDRCTKIRTILNSDESIDLLAVYVNLKFTDGEQRIIDDFDFIETIFDKKNIVVAGHGGSGKTIFMKYFWISLFESRQSSIPVFIELRRFNDITSDDFLLFMFRSIVGSNSKIQKTDFEKALKAGAFTIIFDAFDEVATERKPLVEIEINKLSKNFPDLVIVLSSRYDERFRGWQSFSVYHVCPLEKNQVINLINKIDYNVKTKKKFVKEIQNSLYEKHQSFLSSPLLATMMLVTFDKFAEIPDQTHIYYEQAFDTLFAHHDATKETYKRTNYSGLSIDKFKKTLSYFCLISYYDAKLEYTDEELRAYVDKTLKIIDIKFEYNDFLLDLKESVCLLQKDGLHWTYTHRSFQEYFSSYCLTNYEFSKMNEIFPKIIKRNTDTVLKMAFEMKRELVEEKYVTPNLERIVSSFEKLEKIEIFKKYITFFCCAVCGYNVLKKSNTNQPIRALNIALVCGSPDATLISATRKLYGIESAVHKFLTDSEVKDFLGYTKEDIKKYKLFSLFCLAFSDIDVDISWLEENHFSLSKNTVRYNDFFNTSLGQATLQDVSDLRKLLNKIKKSNKQRSKNIDEIFSLSN